jgi:peroxiredoxin
LLTGGGRLSSQALRGNYVVLKPFAAWCAPCRSELPHLIAASTRFAGAPVSFVAVSFDQDESAAKALVEELHVPFPVVYDSKGQLASLGFRALSEMYLFGPNGELLAHYEHCNRETVEDLVRTLRQLTAPRRQTVTLADSS